MALQPFGDGFPHQMRDLDRYVDRMEHDLFSRPLAPYWHSANHNRMHVGNDVAKVVNDEKKFAVNLDVSQFHPNELKVHIDGHQLTIEGKHEHTGQHSHIMRSFVRRFTLPAEVNIEALRSHLSDDGHLSVEAPKADHALPHKRHIPIQSGPAAAAMEHK